METTVDTKARKIGEDVRNYVRDRFTPGDLSSLDLLARFVEIATKDAILELRGKFTCFECGVGLDVVSTRCSVCSDQRTEH